MDYTQRITPARPKKKETRIISPGAISRIFESPRVAKVISGEIKQFGTDEKTLMCSKTKVFNK